MSLRALAKEEVKRSDRRDAGSAWRGPQLPAFGRIRGWAIGPPVAGLVVAGSRSAVEPGGAPPPPPPPSGKPGNVLDALVKFVPTESITLYVAAVSAAPALTALWPPITLARMYWLFGVVLTPVIFFLLFLQERRADGKPRKVPPREWPWWKMTAACFAFLIWALAIPGHPYVRADAVGGAVMGLGALVGLTVLTLLDKVFG